MRRIVEGADGRMWEVRGQLEWSSPATADDFEHEFSAGYVPGIVMLVLVVAFVVALVVWTPTDVIIPAWFILVLLVILLFFPVRWMLRRPWTLVAESAENSEDDNPDEQPERWVGTVRGMFQVRQEASKVAKSIEKDAQPAFEGPLHPVE